MAANRFAGLAVLVVAALVLAGCDAVTSLSNRLIAMAISDEQAARVEAVHDAMLARDTEALHDLAHPQLRNANFESGMAGLFAELPEGMPDRRLMAGYQWRTQTGTDGTVRMEQYSHVFHYPEGRMTVQTGFGAIGDEPISLTSLYIQYVADADRPDAAWTPGHWVAAILTPAVALFCLVSVIAVFRIRRLKRRILWLVFILLIGFPVFTFYSHTGQWALTAPGLRSSDGGIMFNLLQIQFFSAAWLSFPMEDRWIVNVAAPVGALLFWLQFFRGKLARKPQKGGLEENDANAPNPSQPPDRAPDWPPDRRD